ncbi:hypothetical protein [Fretibacterium sp. OH1220_COT-178]|uniref:hypothetical protein n=1 Tax=Fretibacterium sp. OH1220_COT-178 TaxID=2491047 RepID=UPI000F601484|nr:hypothetical protein [Fretibacterium sp. OH1220_COT-178]RRD65666.1 hypothetical protein EII26_02785 [Fretibacterium sp. OH1220_COT-178]
MELQGRVGLLGRLVYYAAFLSIFALAAKSYLVWLEQYKQLHPELIEASAVGYLEEQPLEGILLWDEQVIHAPKDGVLTYLSPLPRRVAKGETVAALDGVAVRVPAPGYFFPALDGQEGLWVYSRLWPEFAPFPFFRSAVLLENGTQLRKGAPLGKFVPQPQVLRCIAYLDRSPSLERSLQGRDASIRIRLASEDKDRNAEVVAVKFAGQKIKVCLRLPFFPPSFLRSRAFSCRVVAGDLQGVMVPDTAVIVRDGRSLVFLVQGSRVVSQDVEGFPADDRHFFITKGVTPGNKLILDADKTPSAVIRLW